MMKIFWEVMAWLDRRLPRSSKNQLPQKRKNDNFLVEARRLRAEAQRLERAYPRRAKFCSDFADHLEQLSTFNAA